MAASICVALTLVQPLSLSAGPVDAAPEVEAPRAPQTNVGAPTTIILPIQPLSLGVSPSPPAAGPSARMPPAAVMGPAALPAPAAAAAGNAAEAAESSSDALASPAMEVPAATSQTALTASPGAQTGQDRASRGSRGRAADGSLAALRKASALLKGAPGGAVLDEMYELVLPSGKNLRVWMPHQAEDKERGMMFRARVPAQGLLQDVGADRSFYHWSKNLSVPVDVLGLDARGAILDVRQNIAPSPPGTVWTKVGIERLKGRYLLTLPAGEVGRAGLTTGMTISGMKDLPAKLDAAELARRVLEEGEPGLESALAYFREHPEDYPEFDTMVGLVKSAPAAERRLYERVLREEELPYHYRGILSVRDPRMWLQTERGELLLLMPIALSEMPFTFLHESGHYLAARLLGLHVEKFRVYPTGGGFVYSTGASKRWKAVLVALAGPALEFAAGAAVLAAAFILDSSGSLRRAFSRGVLPAREVGAIFAAFNGFYRIVAVLPGARYDVVNAAYRMGWPRLSGEISYRMKNSGAFFFRIYRVLFDVLAEAAGFASPRSDIGAPKPALQRAQDLPSRRRSGS
jgi:uncharacterized membrane protein (UPF0127 family)